MNLTTIKNVLTSKVGRQLLTVQKHSPKLLFAAGVVGVVGTVVLAARATLKLDEVLEEHDKIKCNIETAAIIPHTAVKYTEQDQQRDLVVLYSRTVLKIVKLYGPAALLGVASIAALTGSHVILSNRVTGLTAAYTALDKAFRKYHERVVEAVGEEKAREIRDGVIEREYVEETKEGPVVKTEKKRIGGKSPYAVCFDEYNRNWESGWQFNQLFLRSQQNYMNDMLRIRGHVLLNDVYDAIGFPRTPAGAVVGWVIGGPEGHTGDGFVDFGIFDPNDMQGGIRFVNGDDRSVWLDFNVDGVIYELIGKES